MIIDQFIENYQLFQLIEIFYFRRLRKARKTKAMVTKKAVAQLSARNMMLMMNWIKKMKTKRKMVILMPRLRKRKRKSPKRKTKKVKNIKKSTGKANHEQQSFMFCMQFKISEFFMPFEQFYFSTKWITFKNLCYISYLSWIISSCFHFYCFYCTHEIKVYF